ncbi:hypothetical protein GNP92_00365 [Paenibacillus timonensis]|nr:zinc finger-like domain-containing protein [Paenibacillus timonensis]MUG84801.1 hypothetical protein [Paenibacillus timonensis]
MSNLKTEEKIWNRICFILLNRLKVNLNNIFTFKSFEENTLTLMTDQDIDITLKKFIQHTGSILLKSKISINIEPANWSPNEDLLKQIEINARLTPKSMDQLNNKVMELRKEISCKKCQGTGVIESKLVNSPFGRIQVGRKTCTNCNGTGANESEWMKITTTSINCIRNDIYILERIIPLINSTYSLKLGENLRTMIQELIGLISDGDNQADLV